MPDSPLLRLFGMPWNEVPVAFIDFETTGKRPGIDRPVSAAVARFERGAFVGSVSSLLSPGVSIPAEATTIHGITDDMVKGAPTAEEWFARDEVRALIADSQLGAFNAPFDRHFMPPAAMLDYQWPWLDSLSMVRFVDRYCPGKGRHRLEVAAARHGVKLEKAHSAEADARAAGELFYVLGARLFNGVDGAWTLGRVLERQRIQEIKEWSRFCGWLSQQPPREEDTGT